MSVDRATAPALRPAAPVSLPARLLMAGVRAYRLLLSPWLGSACRFEPTCSAYALQALGRHGARRGGRLTLWRLARCHPWCTGGCDPVPERVAPLFTALPGLARHDRDLPRPVRRSSTTERKISP